MSQYIELAKQTITNNMPSIPTTEQLSSNVSNSLANVQSSVATAKASVNETMSDFSSKNVMNASTEFLNSNSVIAKFLFLVLVLIVFLICLRIGASILAYFMSPSKQPYLAKGVTSGTASMTISQDPANKVSSVVYRSNNKTGGIEFSWSTWLWVDGIGKAADTKRYHIFNKGNDVYADNGNNTDAGLATVNNGPGLYLGVGSGTVPTNSLEFYLDVEKDKTDSTHISKQLIIENIPMKKWFHIVYRFQNYYMDCYVNGVLAKSVFFDKLVPKQNYDDVHIGKNGGFSGKLSNLRYYDYALSVFDINAITSYGPNLNANADEIQSNSLYDYLGMSWYSSFNDLQ